MVTGRGGRVQACRERQSFPGPGRDSLQTTNPGPVTSPFPVVHIHAPIHRKGSLLSHARGERIRKG